MDRVRTLVVVLAAALIASACGASVGPVEPTASDVAPPTILPTLPTPTSSIQVNEVDVPPPMQNRPARTFSLGFTPFPSDLSVAAVDAAYEQLAVNGDLYAFHTTEGVPWPEALAGESVEGFGSSVRMKFAEHLDAMAQHPGHEVYLGLTPLDDSRSRLADYWGESDHLPIPAPFDSLAFDDPFVVAAYTHFVLTAVDVYKPDYLAIGLEVNLLVNNAPEQWPALVSLLAQTYDTVKTQYPDLPVFSTVTAVDILPGWTDAEAEAQAAALAQVLTSSDYLALSFYPFMSRYVTEQVPGDTWSQLASLAAGRPIVIAETGYPAQETALPTFGLTLDGTPQKQQAWIEDTLEAADSYSMPFVVNFVSQDYDALWQKIGATDLVAIWRDTGLLDEAGDARPALDTWRKSLERPRA